MVSPGATVYGKVMSALATSLQVLTGPPCESMMPSAAMVALSSVDGLLMETKNWNVPPGSGSVGVEVALVTTSGVVTLV
jgi:hypothetical protein